MDEEDTLIQRTGKVLRLASDLGSQRCPECRAMLDTSRRWDDAVNHMLGEHNWTLFHVGGESYYDGNDNTATRTVAVVGRVER